MEVDQGSFTPLVFTVAGGIGGEGRAFYSPLARLLLLKNGIEKFKVTSWIQSKVNFALLRSMLLCLRRSRIVIQAVLLCVCVCFFFDRTIIVKFYVCNR